MKQRLEMHLGNRKGRYFYPVGMCRGIVQDDQGSDSNMRKNKGKWKLYQAIRNRRERRWSSALDIVSAICNDC
jgi:hypothetical protein